MMKLTKDENYVNTLRYSPINTPKKSDTKTIQEERLGIYYKKEIEGYPVTYEDGNAGVDLRAAKDVDFKAGEFCIIPLGVVIKLPSNTYAELVPRSSTFKKYGLLMANSVGIIDPSYCGPDDEWGLPVYATRDVKVKEGERICQFIIKRCVKPVFYDYNPNGFDNRGGFGSTGSV